MLKITSIDEHSRNSYVTNTMLLQVYYIFCAMLQYILAYCTFLSLLGYDMVYPVLVHGYLSLACLGFKNCTCIYALAN